MTVDARGTTRLYCQALNHPPGVSTPLGDVPAQQVRFVGATARIPEEPDGRIWLPCINRACRSWNCFEWVTDGE